MAKTIQLNYHVPIQERGSFNGDFIITGTAINATTTSNNHKFLSEELRKSAGTLRGVPLLVDHRNEVSAIKGKVISGEFLEVEERIDFKAKVNDKELKDLISRGDINTVSVGAIVQDIEEVDDVLIPKGITFKELSFVAIPADEGATFGMSLREAYLIDQKEVKMTEQPNEEQVSGDEATEPETTEETEAEPEATPETETEVEPEAPAEEPTAEPEVSEEKIAKIVIATMKALKEADADEVPTEQPKPEPEPVEDVVDEDEEDEEVDEGYRIEQSHGSIRGGAFTIVR